jgi:D-sedoheptulose 7-phosphate isomerase
MSKAPELSSLYPFLHGAKQDTVGMERALLQSIAEKARDSREANARFFETQGEALLAVAKSVAVVYRRKGRLFTMGNGGSSCDAAHLAVEFAHPVTAGRPALPAINLTADIALISALGNDLGFEHVFVRQIVAQGRAGDALVGISTSGNSANLIAAFVKAREMGLVTVGFAGGDGGRMKTLSALDHCVVVPTSSIHRIQETQVTAYHILWDLVHTLLADERGAAGAEESS